MLVLPAVSDAGQRTNTPCVKGTSLLPWPQAPAFLPTGDGVGDRVWSTLKEIAFQECGDYGPEIQEKKTWLEDVLFHICATEVPKVDLTFPTNAFALTRWVRLALVTLIARAQ